MHSDLIDSVRFACCIIRVFSLQTNIGSLIDIKRRLHCLSVLNSHVKFETLVDLILAVLDAGKLRGTLSCKGVWVDTVEMTAAEEERGKGGLHNWLAFIFGVLSPRATWLSHYKSQALYYLLLIIKIAKTLCYRITQTHILPTSFT